MSNNMTPPAGKGGPMRRGQPVVKPKNLKGTLFRLISLTKGQRRGMGWLFLLSALSSASAILSPLLLGNAVDLIDNGKPVAALLLILVFIYICDWLVNFLQHFFMATIGQRIILHIRKTLFETIKKLPLSFFDKKQHGELMSRLTNDVDNISTTLSESMTQLLSYGFTIVGILCFMLSLNIPLTLIAVLSVSLIFLFTSIITKKTRKLFKRQQAALGKMNGQIEESISGLNLVKAFCHEEEVIADFEKSNEEFCQSATSALIWSGFLMPMTNVVNNFNYILISIASGLMAANRLIDVGMISTFLLYSRQFTRPFVEIANVYNTFLTAVAGAERIFEILDEEPEPADIPEALPLISPKGDICFDHVSFGYNPEKPVLKDINLKICAGTKVAIVGPTGSGKTTLINLLTRFYDVNEGRILLDDHDLRDYKLSDLRRIFGVVLQDPSLFGVSVEDNLRYGRPELSFEQIKEAAVLVGADSFIQRLPEKYDTLLTGGGTSLSQGERQLLTITRAVLADAPILILDEATSSVDTVTEQKIRRAMMQITEGRTSFIIAHRLSTIKDSDIIILIENGRITEQGTHEELMTRNGTYASMYRMQSGLE